MLFWMSHLASKRLFLTNSFTPLWCGLKNRKLYLDDEKLIVTSNTANLNPSVLTLLQYLTDLFS